MRPSGSVKQDVIFAHFTDTPLDLAMRRIAKTLDATWIKGDDGAYVLTRTHAQELPQPGETAALARSITELLKQNQVMPFDQAETKDKIEIAADQVRSNDPNRPMRAMQFDSWSAENRLAVRLLTAIGAERLAQIPEGDSAWFAQNPTRRQSLLPPSCVQLFDEYVKERRALDGLLTHVTVKNTGYRVGILVKSSLDFTKPVRMALCASHRGPNVFGRLYLTQGSIVEMAPAFLRPATASGKSSPTPNVFSGLKDKVKPTDEESALAKAASVYFGPVRGARGPEGTKRWAAIFSDPAGRDFTSILASPFFRQTALAKGEDMVALVPDIVCLLPMLAMAGSPATTTLGQVWSMVENFPGSLEVDEKDGYVSAHPAGVAGRERVGRAALARATAKANVSGLDLDSLAEVIGTTEGDQAAQVAKVLLMLACPNPPQDALNDSSGSPDILRLYGRLSAQQKREAKRDAYTLVLDALPASLVRPLEHMFFACDFYVTDSLPSRKDWAPNVTFGMPGIESYAVFCLGNGFPLRSTVRFEVRTADRLFSRWQQPYGPRDEPIEPSNAADAIAGQELNPAADKWRGSLNGFTVAPETTLTVIFDFPGVGQQVKVLSFPAIPTDTKFVPYDQLPDKWRDQIAPLIAGAKKRLQLLPPPDGKVPPPR